MSRKKAENLDKAKFSICPLVLLQLLECSPSWRPAAWESDWSYTDGADNMENTKSNRFCTDCLWNSRCRPKINCYLACASLNLQKVHLTFVHPETLKWRGILRCLWGSNALSFNLIDVKLFEMSCLCLDGKMDFKHKIHARRAHTGNKLIKYVPQPLSH